MVVMTTDDLIACFKAFGSKVLSKCTVSTAASTSPTTHPQVPDYQVNHTPDFGEARPWEFYCCLERTRLVWMLKARHLLEQPHSKVSLLLLFSANLRHSRCRPRKTLPEVQPALLIISLSPKLFLQKTNSPKFLPEYGSERSGQTIRWVYEKSKRSCVTPKRAGIDLLQKPNTGGRKAFSLIKESRQKSHLICLLFLFLQFSWCAGVGQPWQRLRTLGKRSHYWKSLTHTSLGMLLMSWKTRTLAVTPNNQSYGKH